jgi:ankyrin repeat protein
LSAAALRSPRLVALLISAGADPNAADSFGNTPLMTAAWAGSAESVRLLLEAGARVDAHSRWGATALSSASAEDVIVLLKEAAQRGVVR